MDHALRAEWEGVPAVDHHCHPLLRWPLPLTPFGLRAVFTEAADPTMIREHVPYTAAYRVALACLPGELGCAATEEAILDVRSRAEPGTYANSLLQRCGTGVML